MVEVAARVFGGHHGLLLLLLLEFSGYGHRRDLVGTDLVGGNITGAEYRTPMGEERKGERSYGGG